MKKTEYPFYKDSRSMIYADLLKTVMNITVKELIPKDTMRILGKDIQNSNPQEKDQLCQMQTKLLKDVLKGKLNEAELLQEWERVKKYGIPKSEETT